MSDEAHNVFFDILNLIEQSEERFLELGSLLRRLQDENPAEFSTLISTPGLGVRKAYYLIEVDEVFGDLTEQYARLVKIGWTKLSMICKYTHPGNLEDMLQLAEKHTAMQLRQAVKGVEIKPGARVVVLTLEAEQFDIFAKSIISFGATPNYKGFYDKELALTKALSTVLGCAQA